MSAASVILVHGGWHGGWCWEEVVPRLEAAGVSVRTIDLPFTGLADDTAAVRSMLDEARGPVVLCAHSYGGAVVTGAGEHSAVRQLVYLAAFLLEEGQTMLEVPGDLSVSELPAALRLAEDGRTTIDPDLAARVFYHDCPAATAARAVARLRSWPIDSGSTPASAAAWKSRPTTYVICDDDRTVPPGMQLGMSAHATDVRRWPTSHSPFYSRPDLVSELLVGLAGSVGGDG